MSDRRDRDANIIGRLADDIARRLPGYVDNAEAAYLAADGTPGTGGDNLNITQSQSETTAVEAAALRRAGIDSRVRNVRRRLLDDIQRDARRHADDLELEPTPRCDATGRDGWMIPRADGGWSDLNCDNVPARGKLCVGCYHRERRWRKAHDLPARHLPAAG
jgi:hypothetical protein